MKSLSGPLPVLAIFLTLASVRARPQANGQPLSVGIVEKIERVNLHEKVNSSGTNNRVFLDDRVTNVRGTTEDNREALLETSPPQIVADLKISSALTTSAVNGSNDETSRTSVTKPTPIGESLKTVTKQLLHSPSATDMTVTDVRTPPKIKNQLLSHEMIALGKGEAVPVIMEEESHNYEKLSSPQSHVGIGSFSKRPVEDSTSPSGLSTWILLNNDNMHGTHSSNIQNTATEGANLKMTSKIESVKTSPAPYSENKSAQKKKHKPVTSTPSYSSTEAFQANTKKEEQTLGPKKSEKKPVVNTHAKVSSTTPYPELYTEKIDEIVADVDPATGEKKPLITLQDSKFKNKTPVIVGRIPQRDKIEASTPVTNRTPTKVVSPSEPVTKAVSDNITRFGTPVVTFPHVPPRVRPSAQQKEEDKSQQTKLQLQKQQQQKLQTQYQQKLQQQKIQQQLQEQQTKPISTTMPPLFSPSTISSVTTAKQELVATSTISNATETTIPEMSTISTETPIVSVIKKTKRPNQKKKKNKTRRRRPTKTPSTKTDLESKVSEDANPAAKIPGTVNKPLSTRIYNYLAREVVPNVGVGIVGLMLTAGLAGLLLYPFGGGIAARRTEKFSGNTPADGHNYYYNEYSTTGDMDHGQAEEQVFGQVLAGMSHSDLQYSNAYSRERPSSNNYYPSPNPNPNPHSTPNNKYKPARYDTVDDYGQPQMAGFKEDMTSGTKYSTLGDANKDFNPADINSKYSPVSNANVQSSADAYAITDPESDSSNVNKYVDPTSSSDLKDQKFSAVPGNSPSDIKTNNKYSSSIDSGSYTAYSGQVGHGTVYNDEVGYGDNPETEHKNHRVDYQTHEDNVSMEKIKPSDASDEIITAEDNKSISLTQGSSKEEQPTYSALEGVPKQIHDTGNSGSYNYGNYGYEKVSPSDETFSESFVPMNVNEQDTNFNHRYSLQVEHGPRSLNLEKNSNSKVRRRRQARQNNSDKEIENEIDGVLFEESASLSPSSASEPVVKQTGSSQTENGISIGASKPQTQTVSTTSVDSHHKDKDAVSKSTPTSTISSTTTSGSSPAPTTMDTDAPEPPIYGSNEDEETFENGNDKIEFITTQRIPSHSTDSNRPTSFSFMDLLKKVAEFKINLGLNILKTTSETLSRYLGTIQSKMVTAMRHINELDKEIRKGSEKGKSHLKKGDSGEVIKVEKDKTYKNKVSSNNVEKFDNQVTKMTNNQVTETENGALSQGSLESGGDLSSNNDNVNNDYEKRIVFTKKPRNVSSNESNSNKFNSDCSSKDDCSELGEKESNDPSHHSIERRDLSGRAASKKRLNFKKYRPLKKT